MKLRLRHDCLGSEHAPFVIKVAHYVTEALVLLPDHMCRGDLDLIEDDVRGAAHPPALRFQSAHRDARQVRIH